MMLKAEPIKQSGNGRETLKGDTRGGGGNRGGRRAYALPYPPSVNNYWRRVGPKTLISKQGREFRKAVCAILHESFAQPEKGRLAVTVKAFPPDRRRRDLDNLLKALLDALEHGGAYLDDSQIDDLRIIRGDKRKNGMVVVEIGEITNVNR